MKELPKAPGDVLLDARFRLCRNEKGEIIFHWKNLIDDAQGIPLELLQVLASNLVYQLGRNCNEGWDVAIDAVLRDAVKCRTTG